MTTPAAPPVWPSAPAPPPQPGWRPPPPQPPAGWDSDPSGPERSRPPVGLQNLLLGLGTSLVAVAVTVFTAVNWRQLDASVQGLILVGLTVLAGAAAALASHRAMPSTGEALGVVAVLLAIADVHALRVGLAPGADAGLFWAGGLAVVAALAWVLGRSAGIASPQIVAAALAQVPLLAVLGSIEPAPAAWLLALVAQALVVTFAADRVVPGPPWVGRIAWGWALGAVALATVAVALDAAVALAFGDEGAAATSAWAAAGLLAVAALALWVTWLRVESVVVRTFGSLAAAAMVLGSVWFAAMAATDGWTALALVAVAGAVLLFVTLRLPRVWGEPASILTGATAAVASLPLVGAVASMLVAASRVSPSAWHVAATQAAAGLQVPSTDVPGPAALGLHLLALAIGVLAFARRGTKAVAAGGLAVVGLTALVLSPLLASLTIAATVGLALGAVIAATVAAVVIGGRGPAWFAAIATALAAYAWATPWSLATPTLTFATLGTGLLAAVAIGAVARRDEAVEAAASASIWVAAAVPLLAGLVAVDAGLAAHDCWAVVAVAAAVLSIVGALLLDPEGDAGPVSQAMSTSIELTSLLAYLAAFAAVVELDSMPSLSLVLATGVLGFGLHAARPHRRLAGLAAGVEALAFVWIQLGSAHVTTVEAYSLPLALLLLAAGLVGERLARANRHEVGSWVTYGPALVVALAPTVWLSFTQPGAVRPLVALVAGAVVLVGGVASGRRALVDVGAATVILLGLHQIAPVVGSMPNWATIGATGVLLLAVGATFEQRRRDLKAVLRRYTALR
ncbi:SCO7613 C-terminal domain-containing membrane protein [Aquihabitans sp. McL0605]|uniref:SCO7613 C-terminal domain-containing membrane protein n=1 Tax=Aquihabitans sp. McL0605 TaxID=3415671 RepID=UPI003CEB2265